MSRPQREKSYGARHLSFNEKRWQPSSDFLVSQRVQSTYTSHNIWGCLLKVDRAHSTICLFYWGLAHLRLETMSSRFLMQFYLITDDDLIQDFLWMDCCCKVTDKVKSIALEVTNFICVVINVYNFGWTWVLERTSNFIFNQGSKIKTNKYCKSIWSTFSLEDDVNLL